MKNYVSPWDSGITLKPGQAVRVDEGVAKDWQKQTDALRRIRGNIIARSIEIEIILDKILTELFYPKSLVKDEKNGIKGMFDNFILKERPMSFNNKIFLFKTLCKEHYLLRGTNQADLLNDLEKVKGTRNRFAHHTLAFFVESDSPKQALTPKLTCYDGEITLNNEYFDGLNKLYGSAYERLEDLLKTLAGD